MIGLQKEFPVSKAAHIETNQLICNAEHLIGFFYMSSCMMFSGGIERDQCNEIR